MNINQTEFSSDEIKWINEYLASTELETCKERYKTNDNVLNGSVIGSYKLHENSEQNLTKQQAITKLEDCNYRTPAKEIAFYLETIFGIWDEKPQHWLYIAQHYTPKTINSILSQIFKAVLKGNITIKIPGAFFTSIIKHKQKRKIFRNTIGGHKQQIGGQA